MPARPTFSDEERALLDTIHDEPRNKAPYLAYADWLDGQGHPARVVTVATKGGFLPYMSKSLEQLDPLLLTVPTLHRVRPDGIRFKGFRYVDPTLPAYVGEEVLLPKIRDNMAELRVFHQGRFLCRAICQELADETVAFRETASARNRRWRELWQTVQDRRLVDSLWQAKQWGTGVAPAAPSPEPSPPPVKLKWHFCDDQRRNGSVRRDEAIPSLQGILGRLPRISVHTL